MEEKQKMKIITDIGGTLIRKSYTTVDLMNDLKVHGPDYVQRAAGEALELIQRIAAIYGLSSKDQVVPYAIEQFAMRKKDPLLLDFMGRVNEEGLDLGRLHPDFFPDVAPALRKMNNLGSKVSTYSNGSKESQRKMFMVAQGGDLSNLFEQHFDTAKVGPKDDPASYRTICDRLDTDPITAMYYSDEVPELKAARAVGLGTILIVRPGTKDQPDQEQFARQTSF